MLFDFKDNRGDNIFFDSKDDRGDEDNKDIGEHRSSDSGYISDRIDVIIIKDIDKCYITKLDKSRKPL